MRGKATPMDEREVFLSVFSRKLLLLSLARSSSGSSEEQKHIYQTSPSATPSHPPHFFFSSDSFAPSRRVNQPVSLHLLRGRFVALLLNSWWRRASEVDEHVCKPIKGRTDRDGGGRELNQNRWWEEGRGEPECELKWWIILLLCMFPLGRPLTEGFSQSAATTSADTQLKGINE